MRKSPATLLLVLALAVLAAASVLGQGIKGSKHDMSASSSSSIKSQPVASGGTEEVCVFCHTPHGSDRTSVAPLWNRTSPAGTYTLYTSDYLGAAGLGYLAASPPVQPNASSKLCMSCHDGTIALGSVFNLPGSGGYTAPPGPPGTGIPMQQAGVPIAGGKMPAAASGSLGTDLSNDHPVGFLYNSSKDPELVARSWPWNTAVKLSPDAGAAGVSTGTVECSTCHNAHDNQYKKFLRMSNTNAALCTFCHSKAGYAGSAHDTATTASYTPLSSGTATNVGEWACRGCHAPHSSGTAQYLQRGAEENTCYEKGCHGTNTAYTAAATPVTPGSRLIQPEMGKTDAHPTNASSGRHKNIPGGEAVADLNNRHAECQDCHNPHQTQAAVGKSTRGTLRISAALKGTWGVEPTFASPAAVTSNATNFLAPATFTRVSGASLTDEYQVCMKCHSNYVTLPAGARNIAQEINPYNSSYHGIVPLPATIAPTVANGQRSMATNFYVNQNTMVAPWSGNAAYTVAQAEACRNAPATCAAFAASRAPVWCSDCHNSDAAPAYPSTKSATVPSGPHGSNVNGALPATLAAKIPPAPAGSANGDRMLIASLVPGATGTPLCVECHLASVYWSTDTNSRMTRHKSDGSVASRSPQACLSCHMWNNPSANIGGDGLIYPHGLNRRWYTLGTGAARTGTQQMVDSFNGGWYTNMDYTSGARKCWTSGTGNIAPAGATPCNSHAGVGY